MLEFKVINNKLLKLFFTETEIGCLEYVLAADEAQIIDILIKENYRKKGYGQMLLKYFLENIAKNSTYIILEVRKSNMPALALYKKNGFIQIDLRKNYYSNPEEDALVLKKTN